MLGGEWVLPPADLINLPDEALAERAADGDRHAFALLVDRHATRLLALATKLLRNSVDAEDVVQETLLGALRAITQFQRRSSVKTWLNRILIRQVALWWRKARPMDRLPTEVESRSSASASSGQKLDVQAALERLSEEHRQILVLREWNGMSYDEMAELLDVPRGTIESRLHRARQELRRRLGSYHVR